MICIVLKSPDGTKSIGLSTDGTTTRDGVTCLPGFLGSVSPLGGEKVPEGRMRSEGAGG